MLDPVKLYRRLLRLYPVRFRQEYAGPMEQQFRDEYREAGTRRERLGLWVRATGDLIASLPSEVVREIAKDLRHGWRLHAKRPTSTILAIASLGLAIGASTGVFTVLNALLLQSLPFHAPERLVELVHSPVTLFSGRPSFLDWARESTYLEDTATFVAFEANLAGEQGSVRVKAVETSANFFDLLGAKALFGRTFAAGEDVPGQPRVAVLSYGAWQQLFGGDPGVIGRSVRVNGVPFQIIGALPARFDYPGRIQLWMPTAFDPLAIPKFGAFRSQTIGRLKADIPIDRANAAYEAEAVRTGRVGTKDPDRPRLRPLREELSGWAGQARWALGGMVLFVLLAACANVAQLVLARMPEREGEFGIRAALGASRARVTQQLVAESTALTAAGALSGSVVAYWVARIASSVAAPALAAQEYTLLDWRVFGFAATLALLLGIAFGALPMLLADRSQFAGPILRAQPGCARSAAGRLRSMLLLGQAALALVLLAGSLTMGHTFLRLLDTDLGFRPDNVVVVSVSLHGTRYQDRHAIGRYYGDVLDRLRNVPGVDAAGGVRHLPLLNEMYMAGRIRLDSGATVEPAVTNAVTPGYFETLGTKILAGRDFPRAGRGAERSVLVNEAFAEQSGLGLAITGRRLTPPGSEASYLIAGVVETTRTAGPAYPGIAKVYWPADEEPPPNLTFVARVRGKAGDYVAPCRDAVRSVDKAVALYNVGTLNDRLDEVLARPRCLTIATLFLGVFALLLAVAGTFGAASQAVAQRTHEFGLRMALGASYWHIRGMLFRGTVGPVAAGIPVGTWMALAAARYSEHVIADASPVRLWSCLAAGGLLLAAALLAAWMGSRRIWSIDPSEAVRRG